MFFNEFNLRREGYLWDKPAVFYHSTGILPPPSFLSFKTHSIILFFRAEKLQS
ncbi:hypothetical protein CLOLEP_02459 [[Clostridium] leptum DSM 753]|uniref:Uncharacterized protein n=1 Tax=[Clostridium] leptum DSM 753 TaxID=428125 RepID=A7VV53_9FIRM|nr:hypothetical protein CLOLEP_02459 [[Clostridium] leptum DSM 753]